MSRLAQIEAMKPNDKPSPFRVLIYGIEGVGKSTFGANAPNPIAITPEGGFDSIRDKNGNRVKEMPNVKTFTDLQESIQELIDGKHSYETLILDSADWIEKLAHEEILTSTSSKGKSIITTEGGYGAGYRKSETWHKRLIDSLSLLREKRQMNMVITAHYHVRTVKDPEAMTDYDAFEIKCHELVSALWREWVDAILFTRFETLVKKDGDNSKGRAMGSGKRVMFTEKRPAFQAKNRYGLPFELPVDFDAFNAARLKGLGATVDDILIELNELREAMPDAEAKTRMDTAVANAKGDRKTLVGIRNYARTKAVSNVPD